VTTLAGTERTVDNAVSLAVIVISIVLIAVILMQTKGSTFSGAFGGDTGSINRTRRGVELRLFQFTIGIAVLFVLLALWSSFVN
jgi:preprotein translocase subunit SecG